MSKETTLENFTGFTEGSDHDFFGETSTSEDTPEVIEVPAVKKDAVDTDDADDKEDIVKKEKAEDKAADDQFKDFESTDDNDDDDDDNATVDIVKDKKKDTEDKPVKLTSKDTLAFLKERGMLDYELEEGAEMTDDLADEILEENWEDSIQARVEETIKELPDAVKDLVRYASKGGNVTELLSQMSQHARTGLDKDSDMETEANQILAVTLDLKGQDYDDEDIEVQIQFLKDSGKLENFSNKAYKKLLARQETERKAGIVELENNKAKNKKQQKDYKDDLTSHLKAVDNFKGITLNKKDKEELPGYIADIKIALQNGSTVSKFQADLFSVLGDTEQVVGLAKLVKSGFDFTSISNKTITEYSKSAQAKLENSEKLKNKGSQESSQKQKKSLADLLD